MQTEIPIAAAPLPRQADNFTYPEIDRIYRQLRNLKRNVTSKLSRRDRAEVLIGACISEGFNSRHRIIKTLRAIGLSVNLLVKALDEGTGNDPELHLWKCDEDGRYHLLGSI